MATYRLWSGTNGGPLVAYTSTPFIAATQFAVSGGGRWLDGLWWWVPTGGDTGPVKTAVWSLTSGTGGGTGVVVPGTTVTYNSLSSTPTGGESGGHWNYIPFAAPVQLAPSWDTNLTTNGSAYLACVGYIPSHGFPDTSSYWGSGPGANGITNGPLIAYSASTGTSNTAPYGMQQGLFSTASGDPSTTMPIQVSGTDNFWVDVQVDDTAPANYSGSYRLWPNKYDANPVTSGDLNVNYTVATEVVLSQACTLNNAWFFSPAAATTFPTQCDLWNIGTGLSVASITSPTWLTPSGTSATPGVAGGPKGQWIRAAFPANTTAPAGDYRVSAFNSLGTTDANWSPKDAQTDYWGQTLTGAGSGGIANGPVSAPAYASASSGYLYNLSNGGATPPYSNGTVPHAQPPFGQNPGGTVQFPQLYAPVGGSSNESQNYWLDLEVTPVVAPAYPFAVLVQHRQAWPRGVPRRGRLAVPVPAQVNPPYPVSELRQGRQPRGFFPRRDHCLAPVPAQLNPPLPVAELRQERQLRGMQPRRGHAFMPVPAQQSAAPNPALAFQAPRHPRVPAAARRGRVVLPVPAQAAGAPSTPGTLTAYVQAIGGPS